ncbi:hypothetical protein MPSEU_001084200 [Mayamaea pseudoterrestris]|nr:hypothetical protein MPSEU_001084200 [Mayamaea pseudoterrestris]
MSPFKQNQTCGNSNVKQRQRRRRVSLQQRFMPLQSTLLLSLLFLLALQSTTISALPFDTCSSALQSADADSDGSLDATEYAQAVETLSNGAVTSVTSGSSLETTFDTYIDGIDLSSDSTATATACRSLYQALLQALNVSFTSQQCTVGLIVGDADRDASLSQDYEYVRFVNFLANGDLASVTDYSELATPVQNVFVDFASSTTIDVTGSKPSETPTDEQELFLADLCDQAAVAIYTSAAKSGTTPAPASSPSAAAPSPTLFASTNAPTATTTTTTSETSFTFTECTTSLAFSDLTRNGVLESNEYVRFLNRLTSNTYYSETYDTLPVALQESFETLSNVSAQGILIDGSAPGSTPTDDELAHLQEVCDATDAALQEAGGSSGGGATTTSPGAAPTTDATVPTASGVTTSAPSAEASSPSTSIELEYTRCLQYLAVSDLDRDDALSETEYLRFLTYASARAISATDYSELDETLQNNFDDLAAGEDAIDIAGSKPGDAPTADQEEHLADVCNSTVAAVNESLNPTSDDQTVPSPPLENAVNATIYNAWIVSDPNGAITAISLRTGQNRKALDEGYATFVNDQFRLFLQTTGESRLLQDAVDAAPALYLADGSTENYQLVDYAPCPPFANGTQTTGTCTKIYSSFNVSMSNVDNTKVISDQLMQQTMKNIPKDLQADILEAYPATALVVVNSNLPIQPPADPGVTADDDESESEESGEKTNTGAIAASIIVVLLLICLVGGGIYYARRNNMSCEDVMIWLPEIPCLSKRNRKDEDADKTADIEKAAYGDDDDDDYEFGTAPTPKEAADNEFKYGDDDDESNAFSVMDQDPSQSGHDDEDAVGGGKGNKFKFGLGKKKTAAGTFDGAIGELGVDAFNDTAANDFADYGFDDPVAGMGNTTDDIFGANGDNVFESAWGKRGDGSTTGDQYSKASRSRQSGDRSGSDSDSGSEDDESYDDGEDDVAFRKEPNFETAEIPDNMRHLDAMVDQGNWDGVMAAATKIDNDLTDGDGSEPSRPSLQESEGLSHSDGSDNSSTEPKPVLYDPDRTRDDDSAGDSFVSYSSEELRRRAQYRGQVEALVKKVVPDEVDNIDAMMDQFSGREAELIHTLQTMEERSATQRARKAVHKSKAMPQRENIPFGPGGTEGSAAIAAASTIGVQVGAFDDGGGFAAGGNNFGFGAQNAGFDNGYGDGEGSYSKSGSYSDDQSRSDSRSGSYSRSERSGSRSYYSDERSGTGSQSYYSKEDGTAASGSVVSGSQYSGSRTGSHQTGSIRSGDDQRSYVSGEGSKSYVSGADSRTGSHYSGDDQGSFVSGDGTRSYISGQGSRTGSYQSGDASRTGSYRSGDGSRTGSYRSGNGSQSYRSGDGGSYVSGEGSRSYRSGEDEGSYISGEGSRSRRSNDEGSYISGEGSRSHRSGDEGSYISGDASRSRRSGDEGSYISGDGSRSRRSGDEGSYVSGEGSRSYRSGEEGSYVSGEGSRSYRSGEDEGSFVSGEGSRSYRSGEEEGSYVSGEGSRSYRSGEEEGSYVSGEGSRSYRSGDEGSYVSGDEGSQSYRSGEEGSYQSGSYVSGDGSRSRTTYSGEYDD